MRLMRRSVAIVVVVAVLGFVPTAYGQGHGFRRGLLVELKSMVDTVITQLGTIQDSMAALNALHEQGNMRITPPMIAGFDQVTQRLGQTQCMVMNVSDATRTVQMQTLTAVGAVIQDRTQSLDPGRATSLEQVNRGLLVSCKFTVLDGSRNDIRGSILGLMDNTPIVALAAE